MDFNSPHFVLYESVSDPFKDIIDRLFKHANYSFKKVTVQNAEEELKDISLAKLPAICFDGVTIVGFSPVCRSIATTIGLDGSTPKESSEIGMLVNFIEVEMDKLRELLNKENVEDHEIDAQIVNFLNELAPFLDARLRENSESRTIVGKKLTWADFVLVYFIRTLTVCTGDELLVLLKDNFPHLHEYCQGNHDL